jgi:hypothetical protein
VREQARPDATWFNEQLNIRTAVIDGVSQIYAGANLEGTFRRVRSRRLRQRAFNLTAPRRRSFLTIGSFISAVEVSSFSGTSTMIPIQMALGP